MWYAIFAAVIVAGSNFRGKDSPNLNTSTAKNQPPQPQQPPQALKEKPETVGGGVGGGQGKSHELHLFNPYWAPSAVFEPLHIRVNDFVEFHSDYRWHNLWMGKLKEGKVGETTTTTTTTRPKGEINMKMPNIGDRKGKGFIGQQEGVKQEDVKSKGIIGNQQEGLKQEDIKTKGVKEDKEIMINEVQNLEQFIASCDVNALETHLTRISKEQLSDYCELPLCDFVSGPVTCQDQKPDDCANAGNVRIRHQFTKPGTYFAVCTLDNGSHCMSGMRVRIDVAEVVPEGVDKKTTDNDDDDDEDLMTPRTWLLDLEGEPWTFARYRDFTVKKGDTVRFVLNTKFHDLWSLKLPDDAHVKTDCDHDISTANNHVPQDDKGGVMTYNFEANTIGTHLFFCSQGQERWHCKIGEHFRLTVVE